MTTRLRTVEPALLESLESRCLLSGPPPYPFVSAGVRFDPSTDLPAGMFWAEGMVDAGDHFTGTYESFDAASRSGPGPLPWAGFTRPDNDRITLRPAAGIDGYASQSSFQFIAQQEFPLGTFVGRDADGKVLDAGVFAEPYFPGTIDLVHYLLDDYFIATLNVMTPERGLESATLVATPTARHSSDWTFEYFFAGGDSRTVQVHIASSTPTLTVFDNGVRVYSTFAHKTNFFVLDADSTDGVVGYGVGLARWVRSPDSIDPDKIPGVYRGSVMTTGDASAGFFGASSGAGAITGRGVADVVLDMRPGTFTIYNAAEYANGHRRALNSGTWTYTANDRARHGSDLGQVELTDSSGRTGVVRAARNSMLIPISVAGAGASSAEPISGLVAFGTYTPVTDSLDFQEAVFSTDERGHLVVLQHAISADASKVGWYSTDLVETFGTSPIAGPIYSWHSYTFTSVSVVARSTDGDLLLWEREDDLWKFTNLTDAISGAQPLATDLSGASFSYPGGPAQSPLAAVVSTDEAGRFIAYVQLADGAWEFAAVEARGLGGEGVHPGFVGTLAGFGTPWGGYNFAGLDEDGHIWALWHSPQLGDRWAIHNLSEIAGGTPRIVSNLTALTTRWNAFQISGLDDRGHIIVTWWAREVGWRYDGLTDLIGGATITGTEIASNYNPELDVMNIVGIDGNGNAVVYWWSPKQGWNVGYPVTGLDAAEQPVGSMLFDGFRVRYTHIPGLIAGFQTITWDAADGHTKRLSWYTAAPEVWRLEDLTDLAQPL